MTEARLVTDATTIVPGKLGPATGAIHLELGDTCFPARGWDDFVVVILEAWGTALLKLLSGASSFERVHFMDGPFEVGVSLAAPGRIALRCLESGREKVRVESRGVPFLKSMVCSAEAVLKACRAEGAWSVDAAKLEELLPALRTCAKKMLD